MFKSSLFLLFIFFCINSLAAHTPIAGILFANAYQDVAVIKSALVKRGKEAEAKVMLAQEHLKFLDQKNTSLDQKIALVNALGWGEPKNLEVFRKHLETKYALKHDILDSVLTDPLYPDEEFCFSALKISAHDLCILGYLQVLSNSERPILAYKSAYRSALLLPHSECAAVVLGLIMAQTQAEYNWCDCYKHMMSIRQDDKLTQDKFRPDAMKSIYAYFEEGSSKCNLAISSGPDAYLLTKQNESKLFNSVIFYDDENKGTRIHILIMNPGSEKMPEVDIELVFDDEVEGLGQKIFRDKLPMIPPGETIEQDIFIPDYRAYNPNVNLKITIDPDHLIPEMDEENNTQSFFEEG